MTKRMAGRQRPSWDESFMFSALWAATRASCKYFQTGAVIVRDKRIIATGYNGAGPGIKNCLDRGCRKDENGVRFENKGKGVCRGVHAEISAMNLVARENLKGTTLYTLHFPCSPCAKAIEANGIGEVVYSLIYKEPESLTKELFGEAGIKLRQLELDLPKDFSMMDIIYRKKQR